MGVKKKVPVTITPKGIVMNRFYHELESFTLKILKHCNKYFKRNLNYFNLSKWRDISCSWTGNIHVFKMLFPQNNTQIPYNLYQNTNGIFSKNGKAKSKTHIVRNPK